MIAAVWSCRRWSRFASFLSLAFLVSASARAEVASWKSIGPPGGTIDALAVCPSDSKIVLAGTNGAGVLRSTDGGESWAFSNQGLYLRYITGIKFSRNQPSVVYVATYYGIAKSTDAGATWSSFIAAPINQAVYSIDVSPASADTVYGATFNDVLKTTDGGNSWQQVNSGLPTGAIAIFVDPSGTVWAGGYSGVYRSDNGGGSWIYCNSGLYATQISFFAASPDGTKIFAASTNRGLLRSTDKGASWVSLANAMPNTFVSALAVDSQSGTLYAANYDAGISKSTDNGQTWSCSKQGLTSLAFIALALDPGHPANLYTATWGDLFKSTDGGANWAPLSSRFAAHVVTDILVENRSTPAKVYAGTAGGVYRTTDYGLTWTNVSAGLGNYNVTALQRGATEGVVYAATQGGFYRTTDSGTTWSGLNSGLIATTIVELAAVSSAPTTFYAGTTGGLFKTTDGGGTWARSGTQLNGVEVDLLAINQKQPNVIYAAAFQYPSDYLFLKSTDAGVSWAPVTLPVAPTYLYSICIDQTEPDTLYVVPSGAGVLKSTDAGATWKSANQGLPENFGVLTIDPRNTAVLYLGTSGRVYKSNDRGEHWLPFGTSDFVDAQISVIAADRDREVWVGTNAGIFGSDSSHELRALFPFCHQSEQELTGFAISNAGELAASLELRLFGPEGQLVQAPFNPSTGSLPGKNQVALLANEVFAMPAGSTISGWAELTSSAPVSGFFQVLGQGLDGGVAFTSSLKEFYFTRVLDGPDAFLNKSAVTSFQIANPGADPVTVELHLLALSGAQVAEKTIGIPGRGFRGGSLREMFSTPADFRSGFMTGKVTKGDGVIGFACLRLGAEGTLIGLNAVEMPPANILYSGQMASGPGVFSSFRLVNTASVQRHITLHAIDEAGNPLVSPVVLDLPAMSAVERDAGQIFGFAASTLVVGSLRLESDGSGVLGDVVFGDPEKLVMAAALPLQHEPFRRVVFSQVANGMGLFTGLALHVPGSQSATVSIKVYSAEGMKTGETELVMPGGSRQARLLTEFIPSTVGQIRGFVLIDSTQPLVAQELFASADSMSAVPGVKVVE